MVELGLWRDYAQTSAIIIAHGVRMAPMHLVWVYLRHIPWYGLTPLHAMVAAKNGNNLFANRFLDLV